MRVVKAMVRELLIAMEEDPMVVAEIRKLVSADDVVHRSTVVLAGREP